MVKLNTTGAISLPLLPYSIVRRTRMGLDPIEVFSNPVAITIGEGQLKRNNKMLAPNESWAE